MTPVEASRFDIPTSLGAGDLVYRMRPSPRFVRSEGCYLVDDSGFRYYDAEAGNASVGLGYDSSIVEAAARRSAAMPGLPSFCESAIRCRVSERICGLFERAIGKSGRVTFETGGANAVELALRIVRSNVAGNTIIVFEGAYHGRTALTGTLSASARYRRLVSCTNLEIVRLPYPTLQYSSSIECRHDETLVGLMIEQIKRVGTNDFAGAPIGQGIAAFVFEPILNVGGMLMPPVNVIRAAIQHFRSMGALIVCDEVFTGLYRSGPLWGFERYGVEPDIVVGAKALANGAAALSFVWAKNPLLDLAHFPPGSHSSTFAGNPFALAVADVVLDRYADASLELKIRRLESELASLAEELSAAPEVESSSAFGSILRIQLRRPEAVRLRSVLLSGVLCGSDSAPRRILVSSTGMAPNVIAMHPPFVTTTDDIAFAGAALKKALATL